MSLNLRKAALKLHGLDLADREWLFEQLPEQYHEELRGMLKEMEEIGIPKDSENQEFGHNMTAESPKAELTGLEEVESEDSIRPTLNLPDYVVQIEQAPKLLVFELLDNEPNGIVATILAFYNWYWLQEYLNRCKSKQRRHLARLAREIKSRSTPRLIEHTVAIFSNLLQERMQPKKGDDIPHALQQINKHQGATA